MGAICESSKKSCAKRHVCRSACFQKCVHVLFSETACCEVAMQRVATSCCKLFKRVGRQPKLIVARVQRSSIFFRAYSLKDVLHTTVGAGYRLKRTSVETCLRCKK